MTECPTTDQLRMLLDAALPAPDQVAVEAHVDHCAACQQALEHLTAGPQPRPKPGWVDPLASTFLARVQALSPVPGPGATGAWRDAGPVPPPDVPGYDVEGELGRGGMGVVFKARHRRLNRTVALKVLTEGGLADPGVRTRFLIEAEAIAQLRHPHVVQVYEFGEHAGRPYLAMEYVDGGNLAERLAAGRRFTPTEAAELVAATADGVAAAHAKGIIHRDLKPSNILLNAERGPRSSESKTAAPSGHGASSSALRTPRPAFEPMVADFGIARVGQSHVTATGEVLGTPSYMAPEQAAGKTREVGTATDVYGLGTILYELLTGRPPFEGETAVDTLQQVVHSLPRSPRAVAPGVPRDLDTICMKCLEKSPAKRYPTADALAADLRAHLDGRTIVARPARSWERAVRLTRRNPVPAAALAAVAATTLGALVWVNEARREEAAARRGEEAARRAAQENERDAVLAKNRAERGAALTAFERAVSLCEAGSVAAGLDEFARVATLAERAGDAELVAVVLRNVAAWEDQRPREVRALDPPDPARPVTAVLLADAGKVLVTASRGGGPVRAWAVAGAADGKPLHELAAPDAKRPGVVGLFPAPEERVCVVYESGHVADWNPLTGDLARTELVLDPPARLTAAGATVGTRDKAGRLLTLGCADGTYRVWDLDRREFLLGPGDSPEFAHHFRGPKKFQRFPGEPGASPPPPGAVTAVDFADVGNMLLTAGETEGVILYGLPMPRTGRVADPIVDGKVDPRVPYHQFDLGGAVFGLVVSNDRQHFLAGGATAVSLWTIHERDRPVWTHAHPDRVAALAFSPDGRLCASGDRGGTVRCWDARSGAFQAQLNFPDPVTALAFPPGAAPVLVVGRASGASALWQLPIRADIGERPAEPAPTGPGVVIRIGSAPDQAVRAGFDPRRRGEWTATPKRITFWPPDGSPRSVIHPKDTETVLTDAVSVSPDGRAALMVVAGRPTFSVCDLTGGTKVTFKRVPAAGVSRTGFLTDATFFTVSEGAAGEFGLWELNAEAGATRRAAWPVAGVTCAAPHPDGKSVLLGVAGSERVAFRDAVTGAEAGPAFRHPGATAVAVDPGGRWAATAGAGQGVRVWPLGGDRPVERAPLHADRVNALAFGTGPSAGVLATASSDGTARFWDAKTGHPLGPPLRHPEAVLSVAFDPAGERVITGCRNGYAKVWPAPRAAP